MDIATPTDGFCELNPGSATMVGADAAFSNILRLQIPIAFEQVRTVDRICIVDCTARAFAGRGGDELPSSGKVRIRTFSSGRVGGEIRARPVWLQPVDEDRHPLALELDLLIANQDVSELEGRQLELELELVFSAYAAIEGRLAVIPDPSTGVLQVGPLRRTDRVAPVLRNLVILAVAAIVIGVWNLWLNGDVYGQPAVASAGVVSLFVGGAIALLVVAARRVKHWGAILRRFAGVAKYPEIHFDTAAGRLVGTSRATKVLGLAVAVALAFCAYHWSLAVAGVPAGETGLFDRQTGLPLASERVYLRHVLDGRIVVACAGGTLAEDAVVLGTLNAGLWRAWPRQYRFRVGYPPGPQEAESDTRVWIDVDGFSLPGLEVGEGGSMLRWRVCGNADPRVEVREPEDRERADDGGEIRSVIEVSARPQAALEALRSVLAVFRLDVLPEMRGANLWDKRDNRVRELADALADVDGYIPAAAAVQLITELWNEVATAGRDVLEREQAIEHAIMARAVLQAFAEKPRARLQATDVDTVLASYVDKWGTIDIVSYSRELRAQWELLFDLEDLVPAAAGGVHRAVVGDPESWTTRWGAETSLVYLRACIASRALLDQPRLDVRRDFFVELRTKILRLAPITTVRDVADFVWDREALPAEVTKPRLREIVLALFLAEGEEG